jgi:ATP-dependent protease ClpP protease subunit
MQDMPEEKRQQLMFLVTLSLFALAAFIAWRADKDFLAGGPDLGVKRDGDAVVLLWLHEIKAPMSARYREAFEEWRGRTERIVLEFDSPGGSLSEGREVIAEIERMKESHEVETRIARGRICASMCVPLFLRGEVRTAHPSARFMFHEPTAVDSITQEEVERPEFEQRMDTDRLFRRYFESAGMDPAFVASLKEKMKSGDVWMTAEELVAANAGVVERLK